MNKFCCDTYSGTGGAAVSVENEVAERMKSIGERERPRRRWMGLEG